MPATLKTNHLTLKAKSDELERAGDYCIIEKFQSAGQSNKIHEAIVLKCPFCSLDMATTSVHRVKHTERRWVRRILSLFGFAHGVTIDTMIQCPYNPTHSFKIKNGKVIAQ